MRKISAILFLLVLVGFVGSPVLAQEADGSVANLPAGHIEAPLPELPNPGLKPGDFFYFLDMWGEAIGEFFTFNPERKAILQAERVLERVAEVNALLEEKGVDAPGLDVAEAKIQRNMAKAAEILERQKARGIEVAHLAKRLERDFDVRRKMLESVLELEEARLDVRKKEIRLVIRDARAIHNFEKLARSRAILGNIRAQKERLDTRQDGLIAILDIEEERLELKMETAERESDILEDEMENLFDERERKKEKRFEQKERALWLQEESLEIQLRQAVLAEDIALAEEIKTKLIDLEAQEQVLDQEQEAIEITLEQEERRKRGIVEMREKALEQIKDAREEIFDVKEEILEMIEDGIIIEAPIAVLELLTESGKKIAIAEQVFNEGNYDKSFGRAMAAERSAMNAEGILEEKETLTIMKKMEALKEGLKEAGRADETLREIQRRIELAPTDLREELEERAEQAREEYQERLKEIEEERKELKQIKKEFRPRTIPCKTDRDCLGLICPMVIGRDTPQCGPGGICICGTGRDFEERFERLEKIELTKEIALLLLGMECEPERVPGYYASCIMDISRERDYWVVTIIKDGLYDDSVRAIRDRVVVMRKDGKWVKGEISRAQKCRPRRGHQYFSTKPCI